MYFFLFHVEIEGKGGWIIGGGGGKGYVGPPLKLLGGGGWPPAPPQFPTPKKLSPIVKSEACSFTLTFYEVAISSAAVSVKLFTQLLILAFSDDEKPFLFSDLAVWLFNVREGSDYPAAWWTWS